MNQRIFDTHIHIWDQTKSAYDWLKNADPLLQKKYTLAELEPLRTEAGITDGIMVQADNSLADTQLMLDTASTNSWMKGVVGWLPLMDTDWTKKLIEEKYLKEPLLVGVRHLIHDEVDARWLLQPNVVKSLELLAQYQIPFDVVGVLPEHIKTVLEIHQKVPQLKMVFDHLNQPPIKEGITFGEWGELMEQAAEKQNFYVKLSGLGVTAGREKFTVENIMPYVQFILTHFGTERVFCGGDWPVSLLGKDYVTTWGIYQTVLKELLSAKELEAVLYSNAATFYNIN